MSSFDLPDFMMDGSLNQGYFFFVNIILNIAGPTVSVPECTNTEADSLNQCEEVDDERDDTSAYEAGYEVMTVAMENTGQGFFYFISFHLLSS